MEPIGVETGVPLESNLDFLVLFLNLVVTDLCEEGFFGLIYVADKVDDAALVVELDPAVFICVFVWFIATFVFKPNA